MSHVFGKAVCSAFCACTLAGGSAFAASEAMLRVRVAKGPKMRLAAASCFGGKGAEVFDGVVSRKDGAVIAHGSSWGPPFPSKPVGPVVLGDGSPRGLPLFDAGAPGNDWPHDTLPSAHHPDRTGFLVSYSGNLQTVNAVTRFGWGVATVDAAVLTTDGGLVTAGMARDGFRAVAAKAGRVKRLSPKAGPRYGAALYRDIAMPGDVYVGRWRDDLTGFDWVWILEKHVDPPARLFAAAAGLVVFECRGVKTISADGDSLSAVSVPSLNPQVEDRFLAGVSPRGGSLLFAGWVRSRSGSEEWLGPLVEERDGAGKFLRRYYDWRAPLAFQPTMDLVAAAGVTHADYLPNGHILVGVPSCKGRSVFERSPIDITEPAAKRGVLADELTEWGTRARWGTPLQFSTARFDPKKPSDCTYAHWVGVSKQGRNTAGERLSLDGLRATDENHIVAWGQSGGEVLRTCDVTPVGTNAMAIAKWKRKPDTPYMTVFSGDSSEVLWSGLLPRCRVGGVTATPNGIAAAGAFRGEWKFELYEALTAPGAQRTFGGGYADGRILLLEDAR